MRHALLALALVACGSSQGVATSDDDITNVAHSPVKEQSIGNCWIYATVGWAESLHLSATRETADLSESYVTYWHWYEQILGKVDNAAIETGGFFTSATKLMNTYGLVAENDFIGGESARSTRQKEALDRVNAELKVGGRLGKREDRTPKNVRAVLDEAFALSPEVRADLQATFGPDAPKPLGADHARRFVPTSEFKVTSKRPGSPPTVVSLSTATEEWEQAFVYGDEATSRGQLRRLQKTMHDSLPALIVWNVDFASSQSDGAFRRRPTSHTDKWDGAHMTLVEDYQAYRVPNYGTLAAGTLVTDPLQLDAALAEGARVGFLRIKNSWGFRSAPAGSEELKGYYDLYEDYLFGMRAITGIIVPKAYDATAPAPVADVCGTRSGTFCAKSIVGNQDDKRLLTCDAGASTNVITCEQGCSPQPAGVPDACVDAGGRPTPPPPNPCKTGGARAPGKYCGASLRESSAKLYSCQKDAATGEWISPFVECARGCSVQPSGVPDRCK